MKPNYHFFSIFLFFICFTQNITHAQQIINFDKEEVILKEKELDLVYVYKHVGLKELKASQIKWFNSKEYHFYAPELHEELWGRFSVKNEHDSPIMIEFTDHRIDEIAFFNVKGQNRLTGDHYPFRTRGLEHKNFTFILPLDNGETGTFYFRIRSDEKIGIVCKLRTIGEFLDYSLHEYLFLGMFYGVLLIISILNLLSYFKLKQASYLYYSLCVFSLGLYSACQDGFAYQFLWGRYTNWNEAFALMLCCYIVFEVLYVIEFLELKRHSKLLYKIFIYGVIIRALYFIVGWLFHPSMLHYFRLDQIILIGVFTTAIWIVWKKKYKPAKMFLIGFSFLFVGYGIFELLEEGLIPIHIFTVYALEIGALFEFVILTYAFAEKLRYERDLKEYAQKRSILSLEEKNRIQLSVNEELEQKVRERTLEIVDQNQLLSEKNYELTKMQQKLWEMNSQMDKMNWILSKDVESHVNKRVRGETVLYENFIKIYPTEKSILKFIHDLKSKKKFKCKKCANNKCKNDTENFIRICSKCGHRESATAFTVLHGVRTDKRKAFYLAYLFLTEPNTDVKELSNRFEMRITTLYTFRTKIFNISNKEKVVDWQKLIV